MNEAQRDRLVGRAQLVDSDMIRKIDKAKARGGGKAAYRINVARKHEKVARYQELIAIRDEDPKAFKKNKPLKAELFDLYNELLALQVFAENKQAGADRAKRTGRTNLTPPKKKRKKAKKHTDEQG